MKIKQGVSLIVLVITIIVMIILAGTIIISLNNSGIISKANEAVEETNLATVREVAQMAWAEAYLDGARSQSELEQAVKATLTESKITDDMYKGYTLQVTENGVEFVETVQDETEEEEEDDGEEQVMITVFDCLVPVGITWSDALEEGYFDDDGFSYVEIDGDTVYWIEEGQQMVVRWTADETFENTHAVGPNSVIIVDGEYYWE